MDPNQLKEPETIGEIILMVSLAIILFAVVFVVLSWAEAVIWMYTYKWIILGK